MKALALLGLVSVMAWAGSVQAQDIYAICIDAETKESLGKIEIVQTPEKDSLFYSREVDSKTSLKLIIADGKIYNDDPSIDLGSHTLIGEISDIESQYINLRIYQTRLNCMQAE